MNHIRGGEYTYDPNGEHPVWGITFDEVETMNATHGPSVITINSLKSEDGVVYTKFVDATRLGHNIFPDYVPMAWEFLKQFSRNADGSISVDDGSLHGESGRVDKAPEELTGGAEIYVYVPDGSNGGKLLTEPILMVYGNDRFTAESALKMAEESDLARLAKRENSVITFVNPVGKTWGEADLTAYQAYAGGLFAERDNQVGGGK